MSKDQKHPNIPTPHITAKYGDFAETVLMPGDPLRAKFIAENFFENPVLVNNVRGVNGYTGYYNGKRVSVMASGMGQPSIGIYSYELFNYYGVENIIRVGSCGSFDKDLHVRDIIIALGACTNGNYAMQYNLPGTFCPIADFSLARRAAQYCEKEGVKYKAGNIFSSDMFYDDMNSGMQWAKMGVLGVEMESAALYCNAARAGKKALCICTVSDSFIYPEENTTAEERQQSFTTMMKIALEIA
ncbi:MAG: purine-nucleoside phosphorylase [Clostridiales bacterium]|nr:purine-nucleoside phosphorylase [Clostridiales bacterium]